MQITNNTDIPLALAVWLVHDEYDYVNESNYISVTKLMKPIRHLVLPPRVPMETQSMDVGDMVSRAMGHSLHDSIEKAWKSGSSINLKKLGYPQSVIDRIKINPEPEELTTDSIPVYLEQRAFKKITVGDIEYTVGGKFDMVAEGIVHDNKSTTAYTWMFGGKDDDYKLQGSLYRWLNPTKITEDFIRICFIFTDWQRMQAKTNPNYPQHRCLYKDIPLMSIQETEDWVKSKIAQFQMYKDAPENKVPHCTSDELWMSEPQYKYYSDPTKTSGRSTKNFDTPQEAKAYLIEKAGKGVIKTIPGEAKRCSYCDAYSICTQPNKAKDA